MLAGGNTNMIRRGSNGAAARSSSLARVAPAGTPVAPAPTNRSMAGGVDAQHREAHAAFTASLEKVVSAHRGTPVQDRESVVAQLALQSSSAARLQRQTHLGTLNMASVEEEATDLTAAGALPLSQTAFKALLRASLAAARLHHGFLTTPHLLLGIISAGSASLAAAPTAAGSSSSSNSLAAAAEAAVVALIDGPGAGQGDRAVVAGAGAAASMLGQSCGLDVVQWVPQLSGPAKTLLLQAEDFRKHQGHQLLTTHHLLAVMLLPPGSSNSSSSSSTVAQQLLQQLGFDTQRVSADVAAALAASTSVGAGGPADEDWQMCEPLGFLHEEFYGSICRELQPGSAHMGSPCLN